MTRTRESMTVPVTGTGTLLTFELLYVLHLGKGFLALPLMIGQPPIVPHVGWNIPGFQVHLHVSTPIVGFDCIYSGSLTEPFSGKTEVRPQGCWDQVTRAVNKNTRSQLVRNRLMRGGCIVTLLHCYHTAFATEYRTTVRKNLVVSSAVA